MLVLASTSPNAWAERNLAMLQEGKAVFDKNMDLPGPVPLMVLATISGQQKKPDTGQKEDKDHGKDGILVVAGNSQFVSNPYFNQYGNGDLFLNTVNFLADEANLITFERPNTHKPLLLTGSQRMTILWIVIMVPLAVLVSGIAAYRVRRSQR